MKKITLLLILGLLLTGCAPSLGLGGGAMGVGKSMTAGQSMRIADPNVSSSRLSLGF